MPFQIAAVIVMLTFYGCYVAKMLGQRRKGIQTDQLGKGKTGFVRWIEVSLSISSRLVVAAEAVSIIFNTSCFAPWVRIGGICLAAAGVAVFVLSMMTMKDRWRAGVPESGKTALVTRGIYQISRNPAFLGFDLVYIGILLMFFNWVLFAVSVFAIVMLHLQIVNVEEDFLTKAFGNAYLDYKKKVCRYLGRKF